MTTGAEAWFDLTVGGRPDDLFAVVGFSGDEAISALYRYDVTLCAEDPDIDTAGLVGKAARLRFSTFGQVRTVHGVLAEAGYVGEVEGAGSIYRVQLVPRLWRLTLTRQNRVRGAAESQSVVDLLEDDLKASGLLDDEAAADGGSGADYALDLHGSFWQRRHTVQRDETDLAFLSRHLEAQGIFYFFDERQGKDVAVFADHGEAFPDVAAASTLSYRPADGMVHDAPSLRAFEAEARTLPKAVILTDFNYRLPHVTMRAEAVVDADGIGTVVRYGDHFRTPEEGAGLARVRADAIVCRRLLVEGSTDCVGLGAGRRFRVDGHPMRLYDGLRVVAERVAHAGWDPRFGVPAPDGAPPAGDAPGYTNRFEGLDAARPYRPEERTPTPVMTGVTHAWIDAAGDGRRAELDEEGRYVVRLGFDVSDAADGAASRPMRMMQPYGGSSQGMHFPLLKGTEVLLSSVDGHPDRPLILGAVPNPAQPSPVSGATQTKNRLRTTSGIQLEMEDGAVAAGEESVAASLAQQQGESVDDDDVLSSSTTWAKLSLDDYDGESGSGTDAYLRLGSADSASESAYVADISAAVGDDWRGDGMLSFTDGNETRVAEGSRADSVGGDAWRVVDGDVTDSIAGSRTTTIGYGDSSDPGGDTLSIGGDSDVVVGGDFTDSVGGDRTRTVDGSASLSIGSGGDGITYTIDGNASFVVEGKKTVTSGKKFTKNIYGESATSHGTDVSFYQLWDYDYYLGASLALFADIEISFFPVFLGMYSTTNIGLDIQVVAGAEIHIFALNIVSKSAHLKAVVGDKTEMGVVKAPTHLVKTRYFGIEVAENSLLMKAKSAIVKG